ncbi:UNVERIFIED_CONTAM: hypothetical protein FKN15_022226 [Acipenser sinensis]
MYDWELFLEKLAAELCPGCGAYGHTVAICPTQFEDDACQELDWESDEEESAEEVELLSQEPEEVELLSQKPEEVEAQRQFKFQNKALLINKNTK